MTCKPNCPGHYSFPPVLRKDGQPDGRFVHKRRVVVVPCTFKGVGRDA